MDDESYDWNKEKQKLKDLIECGAPINRNWVINQIEKYCNSDKGQSNTRLWLWYGYIEFTPSVKAMKMFTG